MTRIDMLKSSFLLSLLMIAGARTAWAGHTVTFYVNGKIVSTAEVEEGASIPFPTVAVPTGYAHLAWTTAEIDDVQASAPKGLVTNATMGNAAIDYYAVFVKVTERTKWQWPYDADKVNGTGIYAIITTEAKAFNGNITSDGGHLTNNKFTSNGAPEGTQELTLTAVTDGSGNILGYTMYAEGKGYLYIDSSTNLGWHASESSYWYKTTNSTYWQYKANDAYVRTAGTSFIRAYSSSTSNGTSKIQFARKVRVLTDYCTKFPEPTTTITTAGWATYAPTYSVSFQEGTSAYIVKAIENTTNEVALHSVSSVPAGTPVLLKGTAGVVTVITMDVITNSTTNVDGNCLRVSTGMNPPTDMYVLANVNDVVGFYLWDKTNGGDLPAGKIFLSLADAQQGARPFIALPGEETVISDVNREATTNNRYFDLQGRRVLQPTKGLYIVNGKLVMIK